MVPELSRSRIYSQSWRGSMMWGRDPEFGAMFPWIVLGCHASWWSWKTQSFWVLGSTFVKWKYLFCRGVLKTMIYINLMWTNSSNSSVVPSRDNHPQQASCRCPCSVPWQALAHPSAVTRILCCPIMVLCLCVCLAHYAMRSLRTENALLFLAFPVPNIIPGTRRANGQRNESIWVKVSVVRWVFWQPLQPKYCARHSGGIFYEWFSLS